MAKRRKEMTSQAKCRLIVFGSLSMIAFFTLVFTLLSYSTTIYQLEKQKKELEKSYAELQEHADELKLEINKLQDPEYLAQYARENYLYSKEGELIIKINQTNEEVAKQEDKLDRNKNIITISLVVIAFVFLYIIFGGHRKKKSTK